MRMLRTGLRLAAGMAALAIGGWVLRALHGVRAALGARPATIRAAAGRSPNCRDGVFVNLEAASLFTMDREQRRLILREVIGGRAATRPDIAIPLATPEVVEGPASGLAVSWLGHSSALLEIDGYRVLTDPVFSDRCSPSGVIGPRRMHPPPLALEALPAVDAIVISHDHYDHLDIDTVLALACTQRASFFVPLGVGAHLRGWGIPEQRVVELDWDERAHVDELTLVCAPARHFSGRFAHRNATLWASWAVIGHSHRAYFGGDSGYTKSFARIGTDHGPFDVTLMPVGAYNKAWPDIHMNPEEAVRAHRDLGGGVLLPIHWCTFRLAPHPWAEPVHRLLAATSDAGIEVVVPKPGQRVDPIAPTAFEPWWEL
jgi:L-ascorbate metabolism protein UlaG (beta-lactamase superfamily)